MFFKRKKHQSNKSIVFATTLKEREIKMLLVILFVGGVVLGAIVMHDCNPKKYVKHSNLLCCGNCKWYNKQHCPNEQKTIHPNHNNYCSFWMCDDVTLEERMNK
jgi:hypothetical protein